MWGAESGHQGGYVKNTTYIIYKDKKPLISDLVTADYKSAGGDSGGIIIHMFQVLKLDLLLVFI